MGSWPGLDPRRANRLVRELLADGNLPFLVELPDRGPGADLVGRTAALLPELAVDLQPSGWRLSGGAGRDSRRGASYLRQDLDELAEAYDGYDGELKVSLCGPWTLAAALALPRGEKALSDPGACRDVRQALLAGAVEHLERVHTLVPGARLSLQWDEPSLTAILAGGIATSSGFGRLRSVDPQAAREALTQVSEGVAALVHAVVLHTCAPSPPWQVIADVPELCVAVDTSLLEVADWDALAESIESGRAPWLGVIPTEATGTHPGAHVERLHEMWHRVGLPDAGLLNLTISPACGLAGRSEHASAGVLRLALSAAAELGEIAHRG